MTVTCSPNKGIAATLEATRILSQRGLKVIPHIAARQVEDRAHLLDIITTLAALGVRDIFVPGGDIDEPVGAYASSLELLRELECLEHHIERVGVAAYPEGHAKIDDRTLLRALKEKSLLADYMVTQICFSGSTVRAWLGEIRSQGIDLDVFIGIPGVHSLYKLLTISMRVGVGPSLRFLKKQHDLLANTIGTSAYTPDELVADIAESIDGLSGVAGLHVFTFNQIDQTEQWRQQALRNEAISA